MYSKFEEKSEKKATDVFGQVKNCISFTRNRGIRPVSCLKRAADADGIMFGQKK